MKKLLTALLVLCTGADGVFGLFASSNEPVKLPEDWGNVLVVYYSATGVLKKLPAILPMQQAVMFLNLCLQSPIHPLI